MKIDDIRRPHFIGVGGAGMSALAHLLQDRGIVVSGCDREESAAVASLRARGVAVWIGHGPGHVDEADLVVVSAAVPAESAELAAARARGVPIIKRAGLLGLLMDASRGLAVAGTHGKTTTTAMTAAILTEAGLDPAVAAGGALPGAPSGGRWGRGPFLVAEADEYDRSFLALRPEVAVITNLEADHLEYFGSLEGITDAFRQFLRGVEPRGTIVVCADEAAARELVLAEAGQRRVETYGWSAGSRWRISAAAATAGGGQRFRVEGPERGGEVELLVPGRHNVLNATAALAAATAAGAPWEAAVRALAAFPGVGRRFEVRGEARGVTVVDDYAHHPTEVRATLAAARERYGGRRLWAVFQPHTYSRTKAFLAEFATAFTAADALLVTDIYAAREAPDPGVSAAELVGRVERPLARWVPDLPGAVRTLLAEVQPGDVVLTLGAGDVWRVGADLLQALAGSETLAR